jgi:hypothetical protein
MVLGRHGGRRLRMRFVPRLELCERGVVDGELLSLAGRAGAEIPTMTIGS